MTDRLTIAAMVAAPVLPAELAAAYLGLQVTNPEVVMRKLRAKGLPGVRIGRAIVYARADLDRWIADKYTEQTGREFVKAELSIKEEPNGTS